MDRSSLIIANIQVNIKRCGCTNNHHLILDMVLYSQIPHSQCRPSSSLLAPEAAVPYRIKKTRRTPKAHATCSTPRYHDQQSSTSAGKGVYLVDEEYLVTAFVPSDTACLASSPGRMSRTEVWISREEMVDFLLYAASLEASVATRSKISEILNQGFQT